MMMIAALTMSEIIPLDPWEDDLLRCETVGDEWVYCFEIQDDEFKSNSLVSSAVYVFDGALSAVKCGKNGFNRRICQLTKRTAKKFADKIIILAKRSLAEQLLEVIEKRENLGRVHDLDEKDDFCWKWILCKPLSIEGSFDIAGYEKICIETEGKTVEVNSEDYMSYIIFTCVKE